MTDYSNDGYDFKQVFPRTIKTCWICNQDLHHGEALYHIRYRLERQWQAWLGGMCKRCLNNHLEHMHKVTSSLIKIKDVEDEQVVIPHLKRELGEEE